MLLDGSRMSKHAPTTGLALPLSCTEHLSQLLLPEDIHEQGQAAGPYANLPAPMSFMLLQDYGLLDTKINVLDETLRAPARGSIGRADTHQSSCCGPSMTCTAFHMHAFLNGLLCAASKIRQRASRADRAQIELSMPAKELCRGLMGLQVCSWSQLLLLRHCMIHLLWFIKLFLL